MTQTATAPRLPALAPRGPAWWSRLLARIAAERRYFQTLDQLSRLSDRDLADIGFHRSQLPEIAREEALRDRPSPINRTPEAPALTALRADAPYPLP